MATRVLFTAAALFVVCVAVAEGASYKEKIVAYEDGTGGRTTLFTKEGKSVKGNTTAGDTFLWLWDLRDSKNAKVGYDTGFCIYTTPTFNFCSWSAFLKGGSLVMSGTQDDSLAVNEFPIVGGTGKYAGAKGYLVSTTISKTPGKQRYKEEYYLV